MSPQNVVCTAQCRTLGAVCGALKFACEAILLRIGDHRNQLQPFEYTQHVGNTAGFRRDAAKQHDLIGAGIADRGIRTEQRSSLKGIERAQGTEKIAARLIECDARRFVSAVAARFRMHAAFARDCKQLCSRGIA